MQEKWVDRVLRRLGIVRLSRARAAEDVATAEINRLLSACTETEDTVQQILGRALNFPWYADDQENFPGATKANGVCVGPYVAEGMANLAAMALEKERREKWPRIDHNTPANQWLETWREGERETTIAALRRWPDGEEEWISPDGRTTVTHGSYAAPTHYRRPCLLAPAQAPEKPFAILPPTKPHFVWNASDGLLSWGRGRLEIGGSPRGIVPGTVKPPEGQSWLILPANANEPVLVHEAEDTDGALCLATVSGGKVQAHQGSLTCTSDDPFDGWAA